MKIGDPIDVTAIPPTFKYAELWEAVCVLPEGKALPIEADSPEEARNVAHGLRTATDREGKPLNVKQRGNMVWSWRGQPSALPETSSPPPRPRRSRE